MNAETLGAAAFEQFGVVIDDDDDDDDDVTDEDTTENKNKDKNNSPDTGDHTDFLIWLFVCFLSLGGIGVAFRLRKAHYNSRVF